MRFRGFFISFGLVLALALASACSGNDDSGNGPSGDADSERVLRFDPSRAQSLLPGGEMELAIRYSERDDAPLARAEITFALLGDAGGASLGVTSVRTDRSGMAQVKLRVGSDPSSFRVRASAGKEVAYLDVTVAAVPSRQVNVDVRYEGLRSIARRTITVRPNIDCDQARLDGMPGQVSQSIDAPRTTVRLDLDPGIAYAVVAWGRGDAGGLLARGCIEIEYKIGDDAGDETDDLVEPDERTLDLIDQELTLVQPASGPFKVELELDVSASSARLARGAREAARALLPQTGEWEANALLDEIEVELRAIAGPDAVAKVAALRADPAVAVSLGNALRAVPVGPLVFLDALETFIKTSAERLVAGANFSVGEASKLSLTVDSLYGSRAGGLPVKLSGALLASNSVSFDAVYDESLAEITVSRLSIPVGLGAYGLAVFDALDAVGSGDGVLTQLSPSLGSKTLAAWVAAQATIATSCNSACVQRACDRFGSRMLDVARGRIATATAHRALTLTGPIWVADQNDDTLVDAIGSAKLDATDSPKLQGTWHGGPLETVETDPVSGELRLAPPPPVEP